MSNRIPHNARISPDAARNRGPILAVLTRHLPASGLVIEIAAGTGEHAVHFAAAMPRLQWQPTDPDAGALASIAAWREHARLPNLLPPLRLDACDPGTWPAQGAAAVVSLNMIHIAPWAATEGLVTGSARLLPRGAMLFLYGPFFEADVEPAPSNLAFDLDLRARNPAWGLRRVENVAMLAARHGFELFERILMPANNLALILRKT